MASGFFVSAASNFVGTLLVDWVANPLGRQLHYLRHFRDNVDQLIEKRDELANARARLQHEIQIADNQLQEIEGDVSGLLSKAADILKDVESKEQEIDKNKKCFGWCPNWWWRYRLSKNLEKEKLVISEILEKMAKFGHAGRVGYPSISIIPTIKFLSSKDFIVSKTSQEASKQILEALKNDDMSTIGLWGMGGSGKTTLVRELGSRAEKSNLFDKVVFTTVSQKPNFHRIQDEIAKFLADFNMNGEQGQRRSEHELWLRLQKEKKILIILDDVWAEINLKEKIGIPVGEDHKGCKVLLTTRRFEVCRSMKCKKAVQLGCLDDEEAWALFERKSGLENSDNAIKKVAGQIVRKCHGLPIAIVTLGSALKGNSNPHRWEATYRRLKDRRLVDIEDINEENAYKCLEVSFDYLKGTETKMCFLLCSLFPEDHEIYVEHLVRYAWGLELYKRVDSIEEVRSEVLAAVDILKNSCLLLDYGERHVKIHDVVRDFSLWIASDRKEISFMIKSEVVETWPTNERFELYNAISFKTSRIDELPQGLLRCPNLKILLLLGDYYHGRKIQSKDFVSHEKLVAPEAFQFQKNLQTLHLHGCELLDISMLGKLTNLRTLNLESCYLRGVSVLGKLEKLEILSLHESKFGELPEEIGDLNNLKLLDLSNCLYLKKIPCNLIRRLSKLEELYLGGCRYINWAIESTSDQKEMYASLSELDSLQKLVVLSLEVNSRHLPKGFEFKRLERYDVCIKKDVVHRRPISVVGRHSRSLNIQASRIDSCKQLFQNLESLTLKNMEGPQNLVPSLEVLSDQRRFNELTSLRLKSCKSMKCLIDTTKWRALSTAFSNLVNLSLIHLSAMEELCNGHQPQGFLQKVKTLNIVNCKEMIDAIPILQNLETMEVRYCDKMQVLFQTAELGSTQQALSHNISLKSLKVIKLYSCTKLRYLFPTTIANSLGQLETLEVHNCSLLEEIIQETEIMSNINLQGLRKVDIEGCNNLTSLSSLSHGHILENLKSLSICHCSRLEYSFPTSMAKGLPQLNEIRLWNLPQFKGRDGNDIVLTVPSLQELKVTDCPQLSPFIVSAKIQVAKSGSVQQSLTHHESLKSLKVIEINGCNKLAYLFSATVANSLGQLETLEVRNCSALEEIIQEPRGSNICLQGLREVRVSGCNNLTSLSSLSHDHILENLKILYISRCSRLEYTFPTSMADGLPNLNRIYLWNLPQLKGRDGNDIVLTLPSLQKLEVEGCPQLTPFIISANIQELEFSEMTENKQMGNMKMVPELKGRSPNMEYLTITTNFQDYLFDAATFNLSSLKKLALKKLPELRVIWKGPILNLKIFQNLSDFFLFDCERLRYIFSSTIARNLPQLSSLTIDYCDGLEQIVEKDETSSQNHQPLCFPNLTEIYITCCANLKSLFPVSVANGLPKLKQLSVGEVSKLENVFGKGDEANVSDDKEEVIIQLPQLESLDLRGLPKLKSFSTMAYHFVLPSLKRLIVIRCPNISTRFRVDSKKWGHAITEETIPSIDENIVEEPATTQQITWPIGSDINYYREE